MLVRLIIIFILLGLVLGCNNDLIDDNDMSMDPSDSQVAILEDTLCTDSFFRKEGYVYEANGRTYLWAGIDSSSHFDITDWDLNECNLRYGLGRETFPALLSPKYTRLKEYVGNFDPLEKNLVLFNSNEIKVYPYDIMTNYEVINEYHNGEPIMIAYCVLADLAAVYNRDYCGVELTFAVSGYTYYDKFIWNGIDAFVLWDRNTESLWWPLIDKAISGKLKGHGLKKFNTALWETMTWEEIYENYPESLVLTAGQTLSEIPSFQPPKEDSSLYSCD